MDSITFVIRSSLWRLMADNIGVKNKLMIWKVINNIIGGISN
jgi:hypothetical protein